MNVMYPAFAEYHFFVKKWLENVMWLKRINDLNLKIPVRYSTPRRAFAVGSSSLNLGDAGGSYLYSPPSQGNNWLPIFVFNLNNISPITSKMVPYEHVLQTKIKDNNNNVIGYKLNKPFLVYTISYTGTLYTALMQDADILTFRFLKEFKPNCYLWIGPDNAVNDTTKGLWAHMELESVTDATEYEPGDISERVIRKDFNWKISEAYIPTSEYKLDDNIIKEVYGDISFSNEEILL